MSAAGTDGAQGQPSGRNGGPGLVEVVIEGAEVRGIDDLYAQINAQVMVGEDWVLGSSLDGLNDLLYGGIGTLAGAAEQRWVFRNHAALRQALGLETTRAWLGAKLTPGAGFNTAAIREQLATLEATGHRTYFELILEVFADHPEVDLVLA